MKPRDFLNFFKTKSGRLVAFAALFAGGLIIFSVFRKHHRPTEDAVGVTPLATNSVSGKPQVVQSVVRPMQAFHPPATKPEAASSSPTPTPATPSAFTNASPLPVVPPRQAELLAPLSLFADRTAGVPQPKKLSAVYAPFGRLIPCETVTTVDSASIQTPIIGLVTEHVYFGGKLIIPAGTEVHGMAQTDRQAKSATTLTAPRPHMPERGLFVARTT